MLAEGGRAHPLSGTREKWFAPFDSVSPHAPRPTMSGPAGSGRAQTLPRWLPPLTDCRIPKQRTGPDLDERLLSIQYVTEPGDRFGQIKLLWALASWYARTGGRRPFSEGAAVPVCSWLRINWRAPPIIRRRWTW